MTEPSYKYNIKSNKNLYGLFSILLTLVFSLTLGASYVNPAYALDASGTLSDTVSYKYADGTLTISGTGAIPDYASKSSPFYANTEINEIVISSGITTVGEFSFQSCSNVTKVDLANTVVTINKAAFVSCTSMSIITTDYVETIGQAAFSVCSGLSGSLTFPKVTSVGKSAFNKCANITSLDFPEVTTLGDQCFQYCTGLTSLSMPKIETIGNAILLNATNFESFTYPASVKSADYYLGITVTTETTYSSAATNANKASAVIFHVAAVPSLASAENVMSVTIGDEATSLNDSAFSSYASLVSIDLNNVETIGANAFNCGSSFTTLTSVTMNHVKKIGEKAFYMRRGFTSIDIPDSVETIGSQAYAGCTNATSLTIGKNVSSIASDAFDSCTSLTSVTVSSENPNFYSKKGKIYKTSDNSLVFGAKELDEYTVDKDTIYRTDVAGMDIKKLIVGASVVKIDAGVYEENDFESIAVADGNQTYEVDSTTGALYTKGRTTLLWVPRTATSFVIPNTVTSIGNGAFCNCTVLTSVTIPTSVTSIGNWAFKNCTSLTSLDIPESVTSIASGAFANTGITSITLPSNLWEGRSKDDFWREGTGITGEGGYNGGDGSSVAKIYAALFIDGTADTLGWKGYSALATTTSSVDISKYKLSVIPAYMFAGLSTMQSVVIPNTVKTIDTGAFYHCDSLKSVYFYGQTISVAGSSDYVDPSLGYSTPEPPAFSTDNGVSSSNHYKAVSGITFYGLAYSQNALIDYAKKSNNTFVPFVVLDGVDEEGLFGYKLTNYNTVSIADMKYTGSALTPTITATFSDTAVAPRELAVGNGLESVTYKDARGQTVDQITGIGTYTATIKGDGNGVLGTKTVSFSVDSAVASNFTDVKAEIGAKGIDNVWYVTDGWLDYVVANGLMSGYTDGSNDFGPVDSITRGQVATILYRYECSKDSTLEAKYGSTYDTKGRSYATTTVFSDEESGAYYTAAVNWAKDAGILTGDSSTGYKTVRPNDAVQRQELCVILARFAQKVEGASTAEGTVDYSGIQGMDQVASWANTGVRWCASYGIIGGVNIDGTYHMNPSDSTWRASMAKMITVTLRDVIK